MVFTRIFALLCFFSSPLTSWSQTISGNVQVHFMNIRQGDAILTMSPNRECVMLIDSGDSRYPGSSKNFKAYIQDKLPSALESISQLLPIHMPIISAVCCGCFGIT